MKLRDPEDPKTETVGQLCLFQEFIQTNIRRSSRRTLDLSKKTEFHRSNLSPYRIEKERISLPSKVPCLLIEPIDKTRLVDFEEYGIVDKTFRLGRLCSRMGREIQHGLYRRPWNHWQLLPCRQESPIGIFQIIAIGGLGILTDHLLG